MSKSTQVSLRSISPASSERIVCSTRGDDFELSPVRRALKYMKGGMSNLSRLPLKKRLRAKSTPDLSSDKGGGGSTCMVASLESLLVLMAVAMIADVTSVTTRASRRSVPFD